MIDKVQKIRKEVERLFKENRERSSIECYAAVEQLRKVLVYIDSLQEVPCNHCQGSDDKEKCDELVFGHKCPVVKKPVSEVWHDSNKEQPHFASTVAIWNPKYKNGEIISRCTEVYSDRIWAYIDDLLKI